MRININEIKIDPDRREASPYDIRKLADSIAEIGLMNPITVDADHNLIAGLHRLEAAKLLEWTEIECTVNDLDSLHAELAEIDENYVRVNLTPLETSRLMLRRKEIYETLHPETKAGAAQGNGMKRSAEGGQLTDNLSARSKSFAQDTAEKLGVDERTVHRQVKIAKNLTPEAQAIIEEAGVKVTQQSLDRLSRLEPEQQEEAAKKLVSGAPQVKIEAESEAEEETEARPLDEGNMVDDSDIFQNFVSGFLSDFQRYAENCVERTKDFGEKYDTSAEHLDTDEIEALKYQAWLMLDSTRTLYEKILDSQGMA